MSPPTYWYSKLNDYDRWELTNVTLWHEVIIIKHTFPKGVLNTHQLTITSIEQESAYILLLSKSLK